YQSTSLTASNGSWTTGSCTASNNCITFTTAANDTGTSDSATSATAGNVCPPAPATGQTDSLPCGGTTTLQGGTESVTANLQNPPNPPARARPRRGPAAGAARQLHDDAREP